jgi:hypothetical protein
MRGFALAHCFGASRASVRLRWEMGLLDWLDQRRRRTMTGQSLFEQLQSKVSEVLAQSPAADIEKNLKAMLTAFFSRLDLVTREEFDIQRQVLLRTREKLEKLEARLAELERQDRPDL